MTLSHNRLIRAVAVFACLATMGLVGAQSSSAATKSFSCSDYPTEDLPERVYLGYWTEITVRGSYTKKSSACKSAYSLVRAYYNCRRPKGVRGTCNGKTVNGLKCRESNRKITGPPVDQASADVTCTKGSKRIKHHYTQGLHKT